MSLEKILERIRLDGEQQATAILQRAEEEACALQEQAHLEAGQIYQAACREAQLPAEGECARLLNEARFEASCLIGEAREHFIEAALENLQECLASARSTAGYAAAMRRLLREVLPAEDGQVPLGEQMALEADPRDRQVLTEILREKNLNIEVSYVLECLGGVNAYSADRSARVVNTIESRIERALPYLRRELAFQFEQFLTNNAENSPAGIEEQPARKESKT